MTTILDALDDRSLFGGIIRGPETFGAWRTFLRALFGLPGSTEEERALYTACTGRTDWPEEPASEAYVIAGRRSRKTLMLSTVAVYLATFRDWSACLAPGERGTIALVAPDRRQSAIALRYIKAMLHGVPMLARTIERDTFESVDLSNQAVGVRARPHCDLAAQARRHRCRLLLGLCRPCPRLPTDQRVEPGDQRRRRAQGQPVPGGARQGRRSHAGTEQGSRAGAGCEASGGQVLERLRADLGE